MKKLAIVACAYFAFAGLLAVVEVLFDTIPDTSPPRSLLIESGTQTQRVWSNGHFWELGNVTWRPLFESYEIQVIAEATERDFQSHFNEDTQSKELLLGMCETVLSHRPFSPNNAPRAQDIFRVSLNFVDADKSTLIFGNRFFPVSVVNGDCQLSELGRPFPLTYPSPLEEWQFNGFVTESNLAGISTGGLDAAAVFLPPSDYSGNAPLTILCQAARYESSAMRRAGELQNGDTLAILVPKTNGNYSTYDIVVSSDNCLPFDGASTAE